MTLPDATFLLTAFATLFVVVDPPGLAPLFIALTRGADAAHRRAVAARACLVAAGILALFGLAGEAVLGFLGISLPAFRIAGGILLFLTALDMLFERRQPRREGQQPLHPEDPSVFPLAIPLIAGPGAIASMILLTGQAGPGWAGVVAVHLVMLVTIALAFLFLLAAAPVERVLGRVGTNVVTRLLGLLLAALAVQFILDGMRGAGLFG